MSTRNRTYTKRARAEAEQATRQKIAAAAAALHEERGIAKTTVADIARRAGVQRLTVYNHFPDLAALLPACTAHWLTQHPMPDLGKAFAASEPEVRLRRALEAFYPWYRETEGMQARVQGERATVPEVDAWVAASSDPMLAGLADQLADGFSHREARPLIALALDFWTWRRLAKEGLTDRAAAKLMAGVVATPR